LQFLRKKEPNKYKSSSGWREARLKEMSDGWKGPSMRTLMHLKGHAYGSFHLHPFYAMFSFILVFLSVVLVLLLLVPSAR